MAANYLRLLATALLYSSSAGNTNAQPNVQHPLGTEVDVSSSCHDSCTSLVSALGSKAFYKDLPLDFAEQYHYAQSREIIPACVVQPASAEDVSGVLKVVTQYDCPFAIKSGGHSYARASSIHNGIVIDLRYLNYIAVDEHSSTISLGPGSRWTDVYKVLAPMNLTVSGSRNSQPGVGGFVQGGGISFLSGRYGWAADTVKNFEVVLANGSISDVNPLSHPDLFFAFRGGGSKFGIVTRFDMKTFPDEGAWGGINFCLLDDSRARRTRLNLDNLFDWTFDGFIREAANVANYLACRVGYCTTTDALIAALDEFQKEGLSDPYASFFLSFGTLPKTELYIVAFETVYSKPQAKPPAFNAFKDIRTVYSTNRISNVTDLVVELTGIADRDGTRQLQGHLMVKFSSSLISKVVDMLMLEVEPIKRVPGLSAIVGVQFITKADISHFSKNGGNAIGIAEDDGPLVMIFFPWMWNNIADDVPVTQAYENIMKQATELAENMNIYHPFKYPNYAGIGQDLYQDYSDETTKRLLEIQKKYDPEGVFTRLQTSVSALKSQDMKNSILEEELEEYISEVTMDMT